MTYERLFLKDMSRRSFRAREVITSFIILVQFVVIAYLVAKPGDQRMFFFNFDYNDENVKSASTSINEVMKMVRMNENDMNYYEKKRLSSPRDSYYERPIIHPKEAGLVSRIWRSNGSPSINSDLQKGSCWCSADEWCMCTPSLAIDVIMTSGKDHIWLIRRQDTGKVALMGGFTEVGETSADAVKREMKEEMDIEIESPPILFGVYNDPKRDARRHTTSVVYILDIPQDVHPRPGDDASNVYRVHLDKIDELDFFIDHQTILKDYVASIRQANDSKFHELNNVKTKGLDNTFRRSICPLK
eukprot:CAMPEP_0184857750 /NCGR_PEP_ID=MMETSP0580-20130426/2899_1 /TAXON_ID=1118495 /ORGANISM="Dactyliosolen fragilissimus" /LENGTH=300 /DNA_ID=CAMNT_0027353521 /DNA_START=13 /DNA_END=915 /DNA_ORIENTATION=+